MKKMKLVSTYSDYGNPDMWDANSSVKCVCDEHIWANKREGKQVLLLIEPRPIQPNVYEYALEVADQYEYVFTHDSQLLAVLDNARPILWGGVWCRLEEIDITSINDKEKKYMIKEPKKTKLISMVSSDKEECELHIERKRIARKYKDKIDVYGTIDGGEFADPIDTLRDYKYAVVIENYIDNIWFSEKLLNCFATKTIPIYYGARDIDEYFDGKGIIHCESIEEVEKWIDDILDNQGWYSDAYDYSKAFLDENYELSKKYENFDEWLYKTYEKEIGGLFDE